TRDRAWSVGVVKKSKNVEADVLSRIGNYSNHHLHPLLITQLHHLADFLTTVRTDGTCLAQVAEQSEARFHVTKQRHHIVVGLHQFFPPHITNKTQQEKLF